MVYANFPIIHRKTPHKIEVKEQAKDQPTNENPINKLNCLRLDMRHGILPKRKSPFKQNIYDNRIGTRLYYNKRHDLPRIILFQSIISQALRLEDHTQSRVLIYLLCPQNVERLKRCHLQGTQGTQIPQCLQASYIGLGGILSGQACVFCKGSRFVGKPTGVS